MRMINTVVVLLFVITVQATRAQNLFVDDLESYTADSTALVTAGPWATKRGPETVRDDVTATPFGSSNKYLELKDILTGNYTELMSPDIAGASATVTTFAFDFYEPSTGGADDINVGYARTGEIINSTGNRIRFQLKEGTIIGLTTTNTMTYSLDTAYRLYVIFNDTASGVDYTGGTVAAGTADIWYTPLSGGNSVYVGSVAAANTQTVSYRIGFRSYNAQLQELWVDNVSLDTGAPNDLVPPPAADSDGMIYMK